MTKLTLKKKHNNWRDNYQRLLQEAEESLKTTKSEYEQLLEDFDQNVMDAGQDILDKQQQQLYYFDEETMKSLSNKIKKGLILYDFYLLEI